VKSAISARNTREVVPIRLSDREREQIAGAAARQTLTLSAFIREAALQASAIITRKATVKEREPEPAPPPHEPIILDSERGRPHVVDGMILHPDGTVSDWDELSA
jgi:hypothetical protein